MHSTNESLFLEMIISLFLKQDGINRVLTETSEEDLEDLKSNYKKMLTFLSTIFFIKALDMDVKAIDPLNAMGGLSKARTTAIDEAIVSNSDADAMAVVGERHLNHILSSTEIQDKFIVLPVSVGDDKSFETGIEIYGKNLLHEMECLICNCQPL